MSTASNKVLVLFGPTAVGKTAAIDRIATDDRLQSKPVVLVSADSVQVYRGLDIGSAKPGQNERARIQHELLDILEPSESFSVGDFVRLADDACIGASAKGALPILSGGTAYYIKAFLYGAPPAPPVDPAIRAQIQSELALHGPAFIRSELARVDPQSHDRIAPADLYRATRALEVYRCSGKALSSFAPSTVPRGRWNTLVIGLDRPREELYARIDSRVDTMVAQGLQAEVSRLIETGYGSASPGMKAIGYAEFLQSDKNLESIIADIKLHTRHYAKRQLTFMRSIPGVHWFNADDYASIASTILDWINSQ